MPDGRWPNDTLCAITLTIDNLGEAADLNRHLWPSHTPIGHHYSVTTILPQFLALFAKYEITATFFIEAWNLSIYPNAIRSIAAAGHEIAFHAWQHEAWGKECVDEAVERGNFGRSWEAMRGFIAASASEGDEGEGEGYRGGGTGVKIPMYSGFRPPGGLIHGERTLRMCREFGLGYISPAAERGAVVSLPSAAAADANTTHSAKQTEEEEEEEEEREGKENADDDSILILPFRWRTVDAYYYMSTFSRLREIKAELPADPQPPSVLISSFKAQIDTAIEEGGFVSFLFHPFLTNSEERMQAMETVLKYLAQKRDGGQVWLAPCREVEGYVREKKKRDAGMELLGRDPGWDETSWR